MTSWIIIVGAALGTYGLRVSMISALAGRTVPAWVDRGLNVVGPAALGAIAGGLLFVDRGRASIAVDPQLVAAVAAFLAVRRTGRMVDSLLVGLPVLWVVSAVA